MKFVACLLGVLLNRGCFFSCVMVPSLGERRELSWTGETFLEQEWRTIQSWERKVPSVGLLDRCNYKYGGRHSPSSSVSEINK